MALVKMKITKQGSGHTHEGELVYEGDVIEVTPLRSAWLTKHGVAVPYSAKRSSKKKKASTIKEETPTKVNTEGEETPESSSQTDEA